jgi:hypothetical protein
MILSGLQAAAAIVVPSFGIAGGRPQRARSATEGLVGNSHGLVIRPGGLRRRGAVTAAATGRQIAPGGRKRHPVEMSLDFGRS